MNDFYEYVLHDQGRTTDEYEADFVIRRRLGHCGAWLPTSRRELERWLTALADAGRLVCEDGRWEVVYREAVDQQRSLFA
jgi:hypothetical protein